MSPEEALAVAKQVPGWMADEELRWLGEQAANRHIIFEIGSWQGRSTKMLAMMCPGVVYSIDNLRGEADAPISNLGELIEANLSDEIAAGKVEVVREPSPAAADAYYPGFADMVFIDGDHEYPAPREDIDAWTEILKVGGLLCGHDRYFDGVARSLDETGPQRQHGPGSIWFRFRGPGGRKV
jgi:predicted O-methyltransferase YrrM